MLFKRSFIVLCLISFVTQAQSDSVMIEMLLKKIASQQIDSDPFFIKGIFPSYISPSKKFSSDKPDNNVFYNGLISYTLKKLTPNLKPEQQTLIDSINSKSYSLYPHFRNRKGRRTYNFWRTDTSYVFPYTNWIHKVKKSTSLPDDLDDTVLLLMALNADDSTAQNAHLLMQNYVNGKNKRIRNSSKAYKKIPAYSVWYGKKFPIVFDICVMSNILAFVQEYHLPWTKADSACLDVIITAIQQNDIVKKPMEIAPYYGKTSIILYHLARLMTISPISQLENLKPQLTQTALAELQKTDNILEKVILSSALIKWHTDAPVLALSDTNQVFQEIEKNNLPFFIGNIPSYMPNAYKKSLSVIKWGLFYHYCPAYNNALLLEYLVLRNKKAAQD